MTSSDATSCGLAVVVDVLEELLAGQVLAAPDDRRQPAVAQADLVLLAGLAAEPEPDRGPVDRGVAVLERRQAERPVEPRVLVVADPDERQLEQPDDRRQDLLARQPGPGQVARRSASRIRGRALAKAIRRSNLASSRRARQRAW